VRRERGAAGLLALALGLVALLLGLLVMDAATYLHARSRAQVAADAAALAAAPVTFRPFGAAGSPAAEAARFAAANGAQLVECRCATDSSWNERVVAVEVVVALDPIVFPPTQVRATSSAEFVPTSLHR
jgi:secretion/DNA translocation related TadE-like protein